MRNKQIKVEILLAAVVVLVATGAGGMLIRPAQKPDQILKARTGDVIWNHDVHARMPEIGNCTVCHHTERPGVVNPKPCHDCHTIWNNAEATVLTDIFMDVPEVTYGGDAGPPAMQIFHGKCIGCHKAMNEGPVGCRDCHAQSFSGPTGIVEWDHREHARKMDVDCVSCHHKDTADTLEADYRACGDCHLPADLMGLAQATGIKDHENKKHGQCHTCHTVYNPENDLRSCDDCHPAWTPLPNAAEIEAAPSLEQAVHARCHECHNLHYQDLRPRMPIYCTDCHKPDPSVITDPDLGPVLFSHKRHAEYEEWACDECHHTDVPGEPQTACYRCHGTDHFAGIPTLPEAMHKNCLECHKEKQVGLTEWKSMQSEKADLGHFKIESDLGEFWWDHRFHAVGLSISCRDCHHNTRMTEGAYATAQRINKEWPTEAGHFQSCANCHGAAGPEPGSIAAGTKAPALESAYERVCVECHLRFEAGPVVWEDFFDAEKGTGK